MATKKSSWASFPHDNAAFLYDGAALKKNWARLHKGDAEPFPTDKAVEEARWLTRVAADIATSGPLAGFAFVRSQCSRTHSR